ncbi:MAG TPA: c-type cytochrome domain-containing protein, partial [Prosthecobacter sp.]
MSPLRAESHAASVAPAQAMGLLKTQCLGCHNAEKKKGGLSLETRDLALQGGDNGPALKAGDASHSALIQSLTDSGDAHMPPKKQLPEKQINLLKAWVNAGATWDAAALARFGELTPADKLGSLPAGHATAAALALHPKATRIAVGIGNRVHIRNTTKPELPVTNTLEGHKDVVQSLAWSPDGTLLASGGYRTVIVWNVADGSVAHRLEAPLEGRVTGLAFLPAPPEPSPANPTLILADGPTGGKATLHRWTLGEPKPSQTIAEAHTDNILSLTLSRDGRQLATGGADNLAKVWDMATLKETAKLEGHTGHVLALAFSPDGKLLLTTAADKEAKTWDIATKELRMQFGDKSAVVTALHWSTDGKRISFWREDGSAWTST